jgi:O-methyltransferase
MRNLFLHLRSRMSQFLWRVVDQLLVRREASLVYYRDPEHKKILNSIRMIRSETKMLLWEPEAYQIYVLVQSLAHIPGDIGEVGTYRGGSAKLMALADPNKDIHTFDTFEGLPQVDTNIDAKRFSTGQYATSFDAVKKYLSLYPRVHLYEGFFPQTAGPIKNTRFSFVHLDVDIYQSTKDSLEFFYTRMEKGGVILSHDYGTAEGVRRAFAEFFDNKPETVIPLMSSQCIVVKQ